MAELLQNHSPHISYRTQESDILFVLNLEIGNGKSDKIIFKDGGNCSDLALDFCQKHGLNEKVYELIVNSLEQRKNEVLTERDRVTNSSKPKKQKNWKTDRPFNYSKQDQILKECKSSKRHAKMANLYEESEFADHPSSSEEDPERNQRKDVPQPSKYSSSLNRFPDKLNNMKIEALDNQIVDLEADLNLLNLSNLNKSKDVSERLYTDAKSRARSRKGVSSSNLYNKSVLSQSKDGKATRSGMNASNRLYYQGLAHQRDKANELEAANMYQTYMSTSKLRNKPRINPLSDIIASYKNVGAVEERLIRYGRSVSQKREQQQMMKDSVQRTQFDFHPKINRM